MLMQILFAGFGGQGVLSMGKMIAEAGMTKGLKVTWLPAYGPEMRGGTSNVTVTLSDEMIASPVVAEGEADIVVAMNLASMNKFESYVKEGGLLVIDSDRIDVDPTRDDITVVKVAADSIAKELGNPKVMNMVVLGAMLKARPILDPDIVISNLADVLGPKKANLVELNKEAIKMGEAEVDK